MLLRYKVGRLFDVIKLFNCDSISFWLFKLILLRTYFFLSMCFVYMLYFLPIFHVSLSNHCNQSIWFHGANDDDFPSSLHFTPFSFYSFIKTYLPLLQALWLMWYTCYLCTQDMGNSNFVGSSNFQATLVFK